LGDVCIIVHHKDVLHGLSRAKDAEVYAPSPPSKPPK